MKIHAIGLTDVGIQRAANEDAFVLVPEEEFFVVADGMGGHASGQVASSIAVECLRKYISDLSKEPNHEFTFPVHEDAGPPERLLSNAIQWANERIFIESMKDIQLEGMGTTVVCAKGHGKVMILGHVGDSRVYRYRGEALEAVTRDHSLLNHYIDEGRLKTPEEIKNFRETNIIIKALGLKDYVDPEITIVDRAPGDLFLLCTDGLTDQVEDWVISNVIEGNKDNLSEACNALVRLANDAGGKDNCTVVFLRVDGQLDSAKKRAPEPKLPLPSVIIDMSEPDDEFQDDPWDGDRATDPKIELTPASSVQIDLSYQDEIDKTPGIISRNKKNRKKGGTLIDFYDPSQDED